MVIVCLETFGPGATTDRPTDPPTGSAPSPSPSEYHIVLIALIECTSLKTCFSIQYIQIYRWVGKYILSTQIDTSPRTTATALQLFQRYCCCCCCCCWRRRAALPREAGRGAPTDNTSRGCRPQPHCLPPPPPRKIARGSAWALRRRAVARCPPAESPRTDCHRHSTSLRIGGSIRPPRRTVRRACSAAGRCPDSLGKNNKHCWHLDSYWQVTVCIL